MAIYNTFIHFTGCIINKQEHPKHTFPYLLSTESSFFSEMLSNYWTYYSTPYSHITRLGNFHLMAYFFYYLPTELPINPYYIKNPDSNKTYSRTRLKMNY